MELNYLAKKLFNKDSFRELSAVELDELIAKYPYSALLHFLYTRKLKDKNAFGYPDAAARSALYFNNPHWLNHQINDHDENGLSRISAVPIPTALVTSGTGIAVSSEKNVSSEAASDFHHNQENIISPETVAAELSDPLVVPFNEPESEPQNAVQIHEPQSEEAAHSEMTTVETVPLFEIEKPVEEPPVPIEPLYSIDYFASQGIRLSTEEETRDKLGKSLKSFTEWLKSMKRIHPEKRAEGMDASTEKHIQSVAEHSNEETEVNTETMAEVLTKQGRQDKAIELYEKLSLLIPAKSAYFAAKIRELKAS